MEWIADEREYAIELANKNETEQQETAFSMALKGFDRELFEPAEEEFAEPANSGNKQVDDENEEFSKVQKEITIGILLEQMEKMQSYIEELLVHIEHNEKESQEEIDALKAQNVEYKRALVGIRTFMQNEERKEEEQSTSNYEGHSLLGKNEKILVLGNTDIRVAEMKAIARDFYGFEKVDFEFITDYEKIKNAGSRIHHSQRFAAVIFGNCPHKVARMGNHASIIDEFKTRVDCPLSIDARTEAGGLKITKQSFKNALAQVYLGLKELRVA